MNCTVYLFGKLSNGYTQYPDDYSRSIFSKFHDKAKATTQIAVHRTSNLMYYGYVRKLEEGQYIGLCVLLNDVYLTKIDGLFSLFENTISNMVSKGFLINFDDQGNIVSNAGKLYLNKEEVGLICESLRIGFSNLEPFAKKLPPLNYSINKDSIHEYTIDDVANKVLTSSYSCGYTYIYKSKGFDTAQMTSYKGVLAKVTKENEKLIEENKKILRQKKQIKYILILLLLLFAGLCFMLQLNNNLVSTKEQLNTAKSALDRTRKTVSGQKTQIEELQSDKQNLNEQLKKTNRELDDSRKEINKKDYTISQQSNEISYLQSSVNSLSSDKTSLQNKLNTANSTISSLRSDLSTLQQNYQTVLKQKNDLWTEKTKLENQLLQYNTGKRKKK